MSPLISKFYGVHIKMYCEENENHHTPHLHAYYQEESACIDFEGNVLEGHIPAKKLKMVQVWIDIHKEDLSKCWNMLYNEGGYIKIKGLI